MCIIFGYVNFKNYWWNKKIGINIMVYFWSFSFDNKMIIIKGKNNLLEVVCR